MADINYVGVGKSRNGFKKCKAVKKRCSPVKSMADLRFGNLLPVPSARSSQQSSQSSYASCCSKCCIDLAFYDCTKCVKKNCPNEVKGCMKKKCKKACKQYTKHIGGSFWWRRGGGKHRCLGQYQQFICHRVFKEIKRWKNPSMIPEIPKIPEIPNIPNIPKIP